MSESVISAPTSPPVLRDAKVVITGGAGFIGSTTAALLADDNGQLSPDQYHTCVSEPRTRVCRVDERPITPKPPDTKLPEPSSNA